METIKLIKGKFTPEEAKEVLLEIIGKKINFHNLKSFSSKIRFDHPDEESEARILELEEAKDMVLAIVEEAKIAGSDLVLDSTIHIAFEAKEQPATTCSEAENC